MPVLRLDGDARKGVAAFADLDAAAARVGKTLDKNTMSAKQLDAAARRVAENADPMKRYNREMDRLGQLVATGKVKLSEAQNEALRLEQRFRGVSTSGKSAFGTELQGGIQGAITQMTALVGLSRVVTKAFAELRAEREKAISGLNESTQGLGSLTQLAVTATDPAAASAALQREANNIYRRGAALNRNDAGNLLGALLSAGLNDGERSFASDLRAYGVIDNVAGAAKAASGFQSAFKGGDETGDFRAIVSKGLAASEIAPAFANEIIQAAAKPAGSAAALGLTDEFTLAATTIAGRPRGSAAEGATLLDAFLKGIESKSADEFRGMNGVEIVKNIKARNLDRAGLESLLGGSGEAISGFRYLAADVDLLENLVSNVERANTSDLGGTAINLNRTNPTIAAAVRKRQADAGIELQGERGAQADLLVDTIMQRRAEQERRVAPGVVTEAIIGAGRFNAEFSRGIGETGESRLERILDDGMRVDRQDRELANEILGRQLQVLESIERNSNQSGGSTRQE